MTDEGCTVMLMVLLMVMVIVAATSASAAATAASIDCQESRDVLHEGRVSTDASGCRRRSPAEDSKASGVIRRLAELQVVFNNCWRTRTRASTDNSHVLCESVPVVARLGLTLSY